MARDGKAKATMGNGSAKLEIKDRHAKSSQQTNIQRK